MIKMIDMSVDLVEEVMATLDLLLQTATRLPKPDKEKLILEEKGGMSLTVTKEIDLSLSQTKKVSKLT